MLWGNMILIGFTKQKQSPHSLLLSVTTRSRFIPVPLWCENAGRWLSEQGLRKLPLQLFLPALDRANTKPAAKALPRLWHSAGLAIKRLHGNLAIGRKSSH